MSNKETLTVQTTTLPHDGVASEPTERSPDMVAMSALGPHLHQPLPTNIAGEVQAAVASLESSVESTLTPKKPQHPQGSWCALGLSARRGSTVFGATLRSLFS